MVHAPLTEFLHHRCNFLVGFQYVEALPWEYPTALHIQGNILQTLIYGRQKLFFAPFPSIAGGFFGLRLALHSDFATVPSIIRRKETGLDTHCIAMQFPILRGRYRNGNVPFQRPTSPGFFGSPIMKFRTN